MGQMQCCCSNDVAAAQNDITDPPPYAMPKSIQSEDFAGEPQYPSVQNKIEYDDAEPGAFGVPPAVNYAQPREEPSEQYVCAPPAESDAPSFAPPATDPPPPTRPETYNQERVNAPPQAKAKAPDEEFMVVLRKTPENSRLGISVDTSDKTCLIVDKIDGGMMGAWNVANPNTMVKKGDRIVAVNGVRGDGHQMTMACRTSSVLEMSVQAAAA